MMLGRNIITKYQNKWWSDNDKMMLGRNIITNRQINESDNDKMMLRRIIIV